LGKIPEGGMNKSKMIELLKNYCFYKSRRILLEKELDRKKSTGHDREQEDQGVFDELKLELDQLESKIDMVDTCIGLVELFNERYKYIIESHYFNHVRIEDIAEMTHMSRSRCYELRDEATTYMARIVYGG
jgi:DNA-directed RNA polymerase specialized sigma subunit